MQQPQRRPPICAVTFNDAGEAMAALAEQWRPE